MGVTFDKVQGKVFLHNHKAAELFPVTVGTRANILATTPTSGKIAYATDSGKFHLYDGTNWRKLSLKFNTDTTTPDMGYTDDNAKDGYYPDTITNKMLANCIIGGSAPNREGAIRVIDGTFQIYANAIWNDVVINFVFREDDNSFELEHQPIGYNGYYEVMSGNSDLLGLNSRPLVRQYTADMGCYPSSYIIINGGDF